MNKTSKKGFALLLFGIMLSSMVYIGGPLQFGAIVGWILGFVGLMMVLGDSGDEKIDNSVDDNKLSKKDNYINDNE